LESKTNLQKDKHPQEWMLAKSALYYFQSTRKDGHMLEMAAFANDLLQCSRDLIDMGYDPVKVRMFLKYNECNIEQAIDYFGMTQEQRDALYYKHTDAVRSR